MSQREEIRLFSAMAMGDDYDFDSHVPTGGAQITNKQTKNSFSMDRIASSEKEDVCIEKFKPVMTKSHSLKGRIIGDKNKFATSKQSTFLEGGNEQFNLPATDSNRIQSSTRVNSIISRVDTFVNNKKSTKGSGNADISAALASLSPLEGTSPLTQLEVPELPTVSKPREKPKFNQIFSEKVLFPRPLFFGHVLPTYIFEGYLEYLSAKRGDELSVLVRDNSLLNDRNLDDVNLKENNPIIDGINIIDVEPAYRNLVGAILALGNSSENLLSHSIMNASTENTANSVLSEQLRKLENPYLSLYTPVWGEGQRLEREKRIEYAKKKSRTGDSSSKPKEIMSHIDLKGAKAPNGSSQKSSYVSLSESSSLTSDFRGKQKSTVDFHAKEREIKTQNESYDNLESHLDPLTDTKHSDSEMLRNNLELTDGRVPLYGCDDASLPTGDDLGIFDTTEGQQRSLKCRQSEEIVAKAVPNIFGSILCPSPCAGPDDSLTWNSRQKSHQEITSPSLEEKSDELALPRVANSSILRLQRSLVSSVKDFPPNKDHPKITSTIKKKSESGSYSDPARIGWWNVLDKFDQRTQRNSSNPLKQAEQMSLSPNIPPSFDIKTNLNPSLEELREQNRSFSELHPATDKAYSLPYLSDRPPSTRYLQIDTQKVGFSSLGQIEPIFCSMCIWHVEINPITKIKSNAKFVAPQPNLNRCGQITETLHFDVVDDIEVEQNYKEALWPTMSFHSESGNINTPSNVPSNHCLQGSRCGVFPISSNYKISNLWAVLIVHKVLSEDSDTEIYLRKNVRSKEENYSVQKDKLRSKVGKISRRLGRFLMPFAFGIIPLVQVIGTECPQSPQNRAVKIPLFKLLPGYGELPIINHIMVLLFPKAKHASGVKPADPTNDGTAVLVMRNFGYLGLQSVVQHNSTYSKDRLVEFTGDLQLRRVDGTCLTKTSDDFGRIKIIPALLSRFTGEPTVNGGRAVIEESNVERSNSKSYAQELAPFPLLISCDMERSPLSKSFSESNGKRRRGKKNAEAYFSSFCNEIIIQPRLLQNCSKQNICIKVEIRHLYWCKQSKCQVAVLPPSGPSIHNQRRGAFLVHDAYSTIAYHKTNPKFFDDFKIKLPLVLNTKPHGKNNDNSGRLIVLFSIYNIRVRVRGSSAIPELLGCGFLPLASNDDIPCLISNGLHDVEIKFMAKPKPQMTDIRNNSRDMLNKISSERNAAVGESSFINFPSESLILDPLKKGQEEDDDSTTQLNTSSPTSNSASTYDERRQLKECDETQSTSGFHSMIGCMLLQVRVVGLSSIHPQNATLAEYFVNIPKIPKQLSAKELQQCKTFDATKQLETYPESEMMNDAILLQLTKDITQSTLCPVNEISSHFIRILFQLWRTIILGNGEVCLTWANPKNLIPLRLHSFSSLLYIFNTVCEFMAQTESTILDGKRKWNMTSMGNIVSLLFDEIDVLESPSCLPTNEKEMPLLVISAEHKHNDNTTLDSLERKNDILLTRKTHIKSDKEEAQTVRYEKSPSSSTQSLQTQQMPSSKKNRPLSSSILQNSVSNSIKSVQSKESSAVKDLVNLFGGSTTVTHRRQKTLPTIQEDNDKIEDCKNRKKIKIINTNTRDALDKELILHDKSSCTETKQMRIPVLDLKLPNDNNAKNDRKKDNIDEIKKTVPSNDHIETAGEAFLETVSKNLGYGLPSKELGGEENRVGFAHHRKTRSRCSIDWTLPPTDFLSENQDSSKGVSKTVEVTRVKKDDKEKENSTINGIVHVDLDESLQKKIMLPCFSKRINCKQDRWFPYAYEIIIFQWFALLKEQTKQQFKSRENGNLKIQSNVHPLNDSAQRTFGFTIICAPILFEIIKKSLAWRIDSLFRRQRKIIDEYNDIIDTPPPLVTLDETLLSTLESLIIIVTDACIYNRDIDFQSFRQKAIDVNDAVVCFLRDLFAYLESPTVHRLLVVYFSRFSQGKKSITTRYSRETRLKLNAVTLFVRFNDLIKINSATLSGWPFSSLDDKDDLDMIDFAVENYQGNSQYPLWKHHWLIELIIHFCLLAIRHVDQTIQNRASALLYEIFWTMSEEGRINGMSSVIASMFFVPFIEEILNNVSHLSYSPKSSQLRKDILPCVVFVCQSAPIDLMRDLWRKLIRRMGYLQEDFGGINDMYVTNSVHNVHSTSDNRDSYKSLANESTILDVFSIFNLSLKTFEFEGSEDKRIFNEEFLWSLERNLEEDESSSLRYTTSANRKWHAHDGAIIIINTSRHIVREALYIKTTEENNGSRLWKGLGSSSTKVLLKECKTDECKTKEFQPNCEKQNHFESFHFSLKNIIIFVRASTSLYLNCLTLKQSDIVLVKTLIASVEVVLGFGIKIYLAAVGETLQHWMRIVLFHCGARRAEVRVQALEFLALLLRLTWECYGSFSRVRIPILAVLSDVMEQIVINSTSRAYRDQQHINTPIQLTNEYAEAALTPLWRTLDRLRDSCSQNNAFKIAQQRLGGKMKNIFKAYIAAHAYEITKFDSSILTKSHNGNNAQINRVLTSSAGFSKQFLVNSQKDSIIHSEAVEEAFLAAANVFSPTELPFQKLHWLRKLAEFHSKRKNKFAEEATCRFQIYDTLRQAELLQDSIWCFIPFSPWVDSCHQNFHADSTKNGRGSWFECDSDLNEYSYSEPHKFDVSCVENCIKKDHLLRPIVRQIVNNIRIKRSNWDLCGNKNLFCGVASAFEYNPIPHSVSINRETQEDMIEEVEAAGGLYLKAGIIENSRYTWSLATQYYSETFNYGKLSYVYRRLALVVESNIPVIDTSNIHELSSPLGRFYRVWFHGGDTDDLMGIEFVYRADTSMTLEDFGESLCAIIPDNIPIDLLLNGQIDSKKRNKQKPRGGAAPREAITIKVTPLRALLNRETCARGSQEWFHRKIENSDFSFTTSSLLNELDITSSSLKLSEDSCYPKDIVNKKRCRRSSSSLTSINVNEIERTTETHVNGIVGKGDLIGVDRFSFTQPIKKDIRLANDWLNVSNKDLSEKSLRVTELSVEYLFPSCVSRQKVVTRAVFVQSPLEAGVEAVCSWCAVLFRTIVSSYGLSVIGSKDQGIDAAAIDVVNDCIQCGPVTKIGQKLLSDTHSLSIEGKLNNPGVQPEKLEKNMLIMIRVKLARSIVMFLELLHLLIARNHDVLLSDVQTRMRSDSNSSSFHSELQSSFVFMVKTLYPLISKTINNETPPWLKSCCKDDYFNSFLYIQTKHAMAEKFIIPSDNIQTKYQPKHDEALEKNLHPLNVTSSSNPVQSISSA